MKKLIALIFLSLILLSGCSSERSDYKKAVKAYNNQDYQSAIDLFKTLGNYEDSSVYLVKATQEIIEQKIDELGDSIEDSSALSEMLAASTTLSQEQFAEIPNANIFEELLVSYIDSLGQKNRWDEALELIQQEDTSMLSDDCVKSCLKTYGRWACVDSAEDYVKGRLKSPKSYYRYKASVSTVSERSDFYIVDVYLTYGATNSFGGEVTNDEKIVINFTIDPDTKTVQFDCVGNELDALADALKKAGF